MLDLLLASLLSALPGTCPPNAFQKYADEEEDKDLDKLHYINVRPCRAQPVCSHALPFQAALKAPSPFLKQTRLDQDLQQSIEWIAARSAMQVTFFLPCVLTLRSSRNESRRSHQSRKLGKSCGDQVQ